MRAQLGAIPGALEAYLALRGLRTLPVRLAVAQRNAQTLAERLAERYLVHYPGLPDDPGHERATRLMDGYGAMLAFEHPDADEVCRARARDHPREVARRRRVADRAPRAGAAAARAWAASTSKTCGTTWSEAL